jgi:CRISPR-associated endonuclease/helicase Cas3
VSTLPPLPQFEEFYRAIHSRDPFPWQSRLARQVVASGWPSEVGVPTGLGKTACIDIAVWAQAADADRPPSERTSPTRIWYVVDRRLLVDAASNHVTTLAARLGDPDEPDPVIAVARRLSARSAVSGRGPLWVGRLRGGVAQDLLPPDPAQPAVMCSTVDMFASRLLFRGFGVSRGMWPVHAAHAGIDSLVLLDEAHMAECLREMIEELPACDASHGGVLRVPGRFRPTDGPAGVVGTRRARPSLVSLTATGRAEGHARFDLDEVDLAHPIVIKRLNARKPTQLRSTDQRGLATCLASCAEELAKAVMVEAGRCPAVLVFVNAPATARSVAQILGCRRSELDAELLVLTGQLRGPDAERVRASLLDPIAGCPSGGLGVRERPLIVVATQTLEVGADLDVDALVSETAGVRALTQRWGRLNRLGERPWARAVLVHPTDRGSSHLYGGEPDELWARWEGAGMTQLELGPAVIADQLGPPSDTSGFAGALLGSHLWELAKTSPPPPGAAPPDLFYRALDEREDRRVAVAWRTVGPAVDDSAESDSSGHRLLAPLSNAETVEVPIGELRAFVESLQSAGETAWTVDDAERLRPITASELRPGMSIILDAATGGYGAGGWDPTADEPVQDLVGFTRGRLWATEEALANLIGRDLDDDERKLLASLWPDPEWPAATMEDWELRERVTAWFQDVAPLELRLARAQQVSVEWIGTKSVPILSWRWEDHRPVYANDALDELSNTPRVGLVDHLASVGELASRLAACLGLPDRLRQAVEAAGRFHDLGKADLRFQRRLGNGTIGAAPVAKSGGLSAAQFEALGRSSGWPKGARHELLSVQLIDAALDRGAELADPDLVRHLVISHHGHGRPTCPTAGGASLEVSVEGEGLDFHAWCDPGRDDLDQPRRFRALCEQYGYWGLALLEAIVRQADHVVSRSTPTDHGAAELEVL